MGFGREDLTVTIEITDDGQWLLDTYDKLDDPETNLVTWSRFREILLEDEKKYLQSTKRQPGYQVGKKARDEHEIKDMMNKRRNERDSYSCARCTFTRAIGDPFTK